jgi:hypothetical protein
LPHDTQVEIEEFIDQRCEGKDAQLNAVGTIQHEMEKLAANPTLGASPPGSPFEWRRIHRFRIERAPGGHVIAELAYAVRWESSIIVFSGFREVAST